MVSEVVRGFVGLHTCFLALGPPDVKVGGRSKEKVVSE